MHSAGEPRSASSRNLAAEVLVKGIALVLLVWGSTLTSGAQSPAAQSPGTKHKISITFNYDFSGTPVCPAKNAKSCVTQFNLYDISAGIQKKTKLMSFPPPAGANGNVKGITATTPLLVFEPGKHRLAVTAQMSKGDESDPNRCTIWVDVP
jgi:hypothetical protein